MSMWVHDDDRIARVYRQGAVLLGPLVTAALAGRRSRCGRGLAAVPFSAVAATGHVMFAFLCASTVVMTMAVIVFDVRLIHVCVRETLECTRQDIFGSIYGVSGLLAK